MKWQPPCWPGPSHRWQHLPTPLEEGDLMTRRVMFREQCEYCNLVRTYHAPSARERAMGAATVIKWERW